MHVASRVHKIRTPDGLTLTVEEAGAGVPLIFAHGLTSNRSQSRRQLFHLASEFHVIVFDQRGHADSSPINNAAQFNVVSMADDIGLILDFFGLQSAIVGGESLGAGTALRFSLSYPARVKALILCLPALSNQPIEMRHIIREIGVEVRAMGIDAFAEQNAQQSIAAGVNEQSAYSWADVLRSHETNSLSVACELASDWLIYQDDSELDALRFPAHVLAIDNDAVHPLALAQRLASRITGATLSEVQPAGRYQTEPSVVGDYIRGFISKLL